MRHLRNISSDDYKLYFRTTINTRSINHGTTDVISVLNLVSEVSLSLHGFVTSNRILLSTLNNNTDQF